MKELSFREFAWVTQAVFGAGTLTSGDDGLMQVRTQLLRR